MWPFTWKTITPPKLFKESQNILYTGFFVYACVLEKEWCLDELFKITERFWERKQGEETLTFRNL